MRNLACEPLPNESLDRLLRSFAFRNSLTGFDFIYNFHMAVGVPAPTPACPPLLCPSFWVLFYQMLHVKGECEKHWREENRGWLEVTLEHQELQVSSWVCRGCSIFQSRRALGSILYSRKVRKISVKQGNTKAFFSHWVISPGNFICWALPWYMLFITSLSTQYCCWKHFHSLVI